uniref:dolichyl-phosphate-mannose--protein mannosyltransferase n=2 Tax=Ixodes ricinus TaxID=34613 RepID=A0A131XZU2_IXORI
MTQLFDHNRNATGVKNGAFRGSDRIEGPYWDRALPVPPWALRLGPCLVVVASLACFANSVSGDFVFDDSEAVVNNANVRPETPLSRLLEDDFWGTRLLAPSSHKSYRPLTTLTFKLNCLVAGGLSAPQFHLVNLALHAAVSLLCLGALFPVLLQGAPRASLLCALLFAVHPVHTENVSAVVGRADLLCALFFVLSFLCFVRSCCANTPCGEGGLQYDVRSSCLWLLGSAALAVVSMLCKEPGITVIGVCFVYDVVVICKIDLARIITLLQNRFAGAQKWLLPLVLRQATLATAGYWALALRWKVMGSSSPVFQKIDNPASFEESLWVRAANYQHVYALNVWLLLCPEWLCFDWSMGCLALIRSAGDLRLLGVAALWVAGALLAHQALLGRDARLRRLLCMCLALMVVPFLPASNLFFRVGFVVAERVLYLPSLGFCALVVVGAAHLAAWAPRHSKILQLSLVALLVVFICRSIQRSHDWRSEVDLYRSGLKVCPLNAKVHYNIAKNAGDSGQRDAAIEGYREALRLHPDYDQAMNNLANILKDLDQLSEARELLERAIQIRPDFAAAWMNLGIVQSSLGMQSEAERSYRMAIQHRSKYPDCYYNLGNLYLKQGRYEEAYRAWRNATRQRPSHLSSWNNLVIMLDQRGLLAEAERAALQGLAQLGQEPSLHFNLANTLGKAGKYRRSEHHFLRALALSPDNPSYHTNLGVLYHRWKKFDKAEESYRRALQLNPDLRSAQENLEMLLQQKRPQGTAAKPRDTKRNRRT